MSAESITAEENSWVDQDNLALRAWLDKHRIEEIECIIPDMTGSTRGKYISRQKFLTEETRLPHDILMQNIVGQYVDEHEELLGVTDGDMMLRPDVSSIRLSPWTHKPTAQIIHDCLDVDGKLHDLASRSVLKNVLALYDKQGWQPVLAPEVEFYLLQKTSDYSQELEPAAGQSGRREMLRHSYTIEAIDEFQALFDEMYRYCELQELMVGGLVDESGVGQMEINFLHGDPLDLADQVFAFKRTIRKTALKHNMIAAFMAKPMVDMPGSSMHLHQSIVHKDTGKNIFSDESGKETPEFFHFIGGMQKYTPSAVAIYAPNVNSYRRFVPNASAPINVCWGYDNRSTGIRIPKSSPESRRIENRFAGIDCNPYIAIAASLASGYLGLMEELTPTIATSGDAYEEDPELARTLITALTELDECQGLRKTLGSSFVDAYIAVKGSEFEAYNRFITNWEREHLLMTV